MQTSYNFCTHSWLHIPKTSIPSEGMKTCIPEMKLLNICDLLALA